MGQLAVAAVAAAAGFALSWIAGQRRLLRSLPRWSVALPIAGSALGALFAPGAPTGEPAVDVILRAALGAAVPWIASFGRRRGLLFGAGLAAVGAVSFIAAALAFAALGLAAGSAADSRRRRVLGAIAGALVAHALLRLGWPDTHGATALLAALSVTTLYVSALGASGGRRRSWLVRVAATPAALAAVAGAGAAIAGATAVEPATSGLRSAEAALASAREGDLASARQSLDRATRDLELAGERLSAPWAIPGRALPVASQHLRASQQMIDAGARLVEPALEASQLASSDELRLRSGVIDLGAVEAVAGSVKAASTEIERASEVAEDVNSPWLLRPLSQRIDRARALLSRSRNDAAVASASLDALPGLLGSERPRRYFIAMQTPSEQRGTGGLLGSYATIVFSGGRLALERHGLVSELNRAGSGRSLGELGAEYAGYGAVGPERFFQNVTLPPDVPTAAAAIMQLYPQAGGEALDGVVFVDPITLAALLDLTGSVSVPEWPEPLGPGNTAEVLMFRQYSDLSEERANALIDSIITATVRSLGAGTLPPPGRVVSRLAEPARGGHLAIFSVDKTEQRLFEMVGLDHAMPPVVDDFFQVVTQNSAESKIDWFQRRSVSYEVTYGEDARLDIEAKVEIHNDAPPAGLPLVLIGGKDLPGPGHSRLFVELFTAFAPEEVSIDGQPVDVATSVLYNRYVTRTSVTIPPGGSVVIQASVRGVAREAGSYHLVIGKQPTIRPDALVVTVRGGAERVSNLRLSDDVARFEGEVVGPTEFRAAGLREEG